MAVAGLGLLLVTSLAGVGYLVVRGRPAEVPLHADTVVVGAGGEVVEARAAEVVPGTRVLAGTPDTERLVAEERAWLAAGTVPEVAGVPPGPGRRRAARPAGAEPDLRRTGGGLEPGLAPCLAARLGPGRGGAGPDRASR